MSTLLLETWEQEATLFTRRFVRARGTEPFSGNDLWEAGLPYTGNRRDLSKVLSTLEREGVIVRTGRKVKSVGGHGQSINEWVKA